MKTLSFTAPILQGKTDDVRRFGREIAGPRLLEMTASRTALGQTRETVWVQSTPMGDILVAYLEGADSGRANKQFAASQSAFDLWFKQEAKTITGVDFGEPLPAGSTEVLLEMPGTAEKKSLGLALPVLQGKTEDFRRWAREQSGPRLAEFNDFLRRAGITKANVYLQHTPMGDFGVQYSEGSDPPGAYQFFAKSNAPFETWAREQLAAIHGVDFSQPMPGLPELVFDWRA